MSINYNVTQADDLPVRERPICLLCQIVHAIKWNFSKFRKQINERHAASHTKLCVIELPVGVVAVKSMFGQICINSRYLLEVDQIFHDENGLPSARRLQEYYAAVEKYYHCQGGAGK